MRGVLIALLVAVSALPVYAQQSSVDSLQQEINTLQQQWQIQWRASDSLRIASVLTRLRADTLARLLTQIRARKKADSIAATIAATIEPSGAMDDSATNEETTMPVQDTKATNTTDNEVILQSLALAVATRNAEKRFAETKPRRGQTFSDSLTQAVMEFTPDTGMASYYASEFHGKKMSNGKTFNMHQQTCAHRWLPFGTKLLVTNLDNGKNVVVEVTDRGPFKHGRIIDVSKGAAVTLDMIRSGTALVRVEVYQQPSDPEPDSTESETVVTPSEP